MVDWCKKHQKVIKDPYNETCKDWKYWNPSQSPPKGALFGDVCNGCKHYAYS